MIEKVLDGLSLELLKSTDKSEGIVENQPRVFCNLQLDKFVM